LDLNYERLLLRQVRPPAAQNVFLQLAGGRLRQFGQEREALRDFEMCEAITGKLTQLHLRRGGARPEHDESMWRFAPFFVGQANHRELLHCRMPHQRALDFNRRNVFTTADDDVFQAVSNFKVAIGMHHRRIAAVEPSAAHGLGSAFGVVIVTGHHAVAAKHKRMRLAVQVFSPEEMAKLLHAAKGDQLVALAIGGFAGIRAEEIKRLHWEHLNFEEGHIVVPDSVAKCQERRIVPMTENLMAWLLPLRRKSGPVGPFSNLAIVFQRTAKRAGIIWKRNGLRHSFISYRVASLKNVAQTAYEAGNSPVMVHRHYLKHVSEAMGQKWFSIVPGESLNIVPLPRTCTTETAHITQAG
jgi:hypothetical protein